MTTLTTYDKVSRLIEFATGEPYGDGYTVMDVVDGYANQHYEPGEERPVVVLGDWNDKTKYHAETRTFETLDSMPSRLARSLERVGAEVEWHDEWSQCCNCYRAIRTEPTSYGWVPEYMWAGDGYVCQDCLLKDGEDPLTGYGDEDESYINNPRKAVTWCNRAHVESFGFVKWEPGNEHTYSNGWYPGQTDTPGPIMDAIHERCPDAEVVFFIDSVGQFDMHFSAYVRFGETDENGEAL